MKAPFGVVRDGAKRAVVEGEFLVDGSVIVLRREITADGRSRSFIDDSPVGAKELADQAAKLLDVTSQRAFSHLLEPQRHLDFLDAYARLMEERKQLATFTDQAASLDRQIAKIRREISELSDRREHLKQQLAEVEKVSPQAGEDLLLAEELNRLEHAEELKHSGGRIIDLLEDSPDAVGRKLSEVETFIGRMAELDPTLRDLPAEVSAAKSAMREVAHRVEERYRKIGVEAARLEELRDRQHKLSALIRKQGGTLETLLERWEEMRRQLDGTKERQGELDALRMDRDVVLRKWGELAIQVSLIRRDAVTRLAAEVESSLKVLGVPNAAFEVRLERTEAADGVTCEDGRKYRLSERGLESADFYFSANPGMEPRPVAAVASGGELSRMMLALKECLPLQSEEATILFDEIDSGISGRIARLVGEKLKSLAVNRQLLVITHLPQIASLGDRHLKVSKVEEAGGTTTEVTSLDSEQRVREVAGMLSGVETGESAIDQARQLMLGV